MIALDAGSAPVTRGGAQQWAREELSKAVYHRYDDPLPVRIVKAVLHWLDRMFSTAASHSPGGAAGALALVVLAVAVVAVARWRLGPIRRDARSRLPVLGGRPARAADHRLAAARAAEAGRWAEAVVERMRALARELEERAVLDQRPGRTADELAIEAGRELPHLSATFAAAARVFDRVAYGRRPGSREDYALVAAADDAVAGRRPVAVAVR